MIKRIVILAVLLLANVVFISGCSTSKSTIKSQSQPPVAAGEKRGDVVEGIMALNQVVK